MAGNPYDQFDVQSGGEAPSASANPYDQFDQPAAGASAPRSWGQALGQEAIAGAHGAEREGMGLGNIADRVLPSSMQIPGTSKQDLQDFDAQHAAEFANNRAGKFVGQALPLAAAQFIPGLDVGADVGTGAQLASVGANAALAGLGSAAAADPDHQLSAGIEGAALGGGLAGTGQLLKNAARGVAMSPEAQRIAQYVRDATGKQAFVPVAAGAAGGPVASLYRRVLPNLGGSDAYNAQMGDLMGDVRGAAAVNAAPPTAVIPNASPWQQLPPLKQQFDNAYGDVMSRWSMPEGAQPADLGSHVLDQIMQRAPDIDPNIALNVAQQAQDMLTRRIPGTGSSELTGPALQNAWTAMGDKVAGAGKEEKAAWLAARGALDDVRQAGLSPQDQELLGQINSQYAEFAPFRQAVNAAKGNSGNFSPLQLARGAQRGTAALQAGQDMSALRGAGHVMASPVGRYLQGTPILGHVGHALALPLTSRTFQRLLQTDIPALAPTGTAMQRLLPLTAAALSNPQGQSGQ